jgi:hypothetical protein
VTTPGRRAIEDDEQALVDRLAEAVAAAYVARTPDVRALEEPAVGVVLSVYWDGGATSHWAPLAYAASADSPARVAPDERLWRTSAHEVAMTELAGPEVHEDPALREPGQALLALIEERNAYELRDVFFYALTARLAAAWGVPVVWDDFEDGRAAPPEAQLREQLGAARAAEWERRGLLPRRGGSGGGSAGAPDDALLTIVRPDGIVAGIDARRVLTEDLRQRGGAVVERDRVAVSGGADVTVVGGVLPDGAASARVQDLQDAWHDATVAGELWACVLPHARRGGTPPVVFTDAHGAEVAPAGEPEPGGVFLTVALDDPGDDWAFDAEAAAAETAERDARVLRDARVPVLWDDALGTDPRLGQYGGGDTAASSVELRHGDTSVEVTDRRLPLDDPERVARDILEQTLSHRGDARAAGRAALEAIATSLPATTDAGPEQAFLLLTGGGLWVAVWSDQRGRLDIRIHGTGTPPPRLDLTDRRPR